MENVEQLDRKNKMWELNWNISVIRISVIGLSASFKRKKFEVG